MQPGVETVRYEDPSLGIYKETALKDNRLLGMILVGDIEDEHIYMDWMRTRPISPPAAPTSFPDPPPISGSMSPICRIAKPSADAMASAKAKSSRRSTSTALPRWLS